MRLYSRTLLVMRVLWELLRYDLVAAVFGFRGVHVGLCRRVSERRFHRYELEHAICQTVELVSSFYWRRMLCLKRSVVTARVLHAHGIAAEVVIGYRFAPFFSHAWVEVDGRVVNDSSAYPQKLRVLERIRPGGAEGGTTSTRLLSNASHITREEIETCTSSQS
jgi:hypothetical protein